MRLHHDRTRRCQGYLSFVLSCRFRAESRCEEFARNLMPKSVPMSVTDVVADPMQKYTFAGGVVTKRRCQGNDVNRIIRAELVNPSIRVEKIVRTDPFRESLSGLDIGQYLWTVAPRDDDQPRSAAFNLVFYLQNERFSYRPGVPPILIRRFAIDLIGYSDFDLHRLIGTRRLRWRVFRSLRSKFVPKP